MHNMLTVMILYSMPEVDCITMWVILCRKIYFWVDFVSLLLELMLERFVSTDMRKLTFFIIYRCQPTNLGQ